MLEKAIDAKESGQFGAELVIDIARSEVGSLCKFYQPSQSDPNKILCSAGEKQGHPVCKGCDKCLVGQFTPSGEFTGVPAVVSVS